MKFTDRSIQLQIAAKESSWLKAVNQSSWLKASLCCILPDTWPAWGPWA